MAPLHSAIPRPMTKTIRRDRPFRRIFSAAIALAVIASACGWTLYANLAGTDHNADRGRTDGDDRDRAADAGGCRRAASGARAVALTLPIRPVEPVRLVAPRIEVALLHRSHSFGAPPTVFAPDAPVRSAQRPEAPPPAVRVVQSVPLPTPRPAGLGIGDLQAQGRLRRSPTIRSRSCSASLRAPARRSPMRRRTAASSTTEKA